jgi:hypothetical protein
MAHQYGLVAVSSRITLEPVANIPDPIRILVSEITYVAR